jgi:aspartate-semialdehyde dehydrogenase
MAKDVAVVGATGAVGSEMLKALERRDFPVRKIHALASERSAGAKVKFCEKDVAVEALSEKTIPEVDIALFSAGGAVSKKFAPLFAKRGIVVVDNSSAFRMSPEVPLVVPEVNPHAAARHKGIISNPNCSTIQMVLVLKPIHDAAKIKRVVVSTYQSVSGAGWQAMQELLAQTRDVLAGKPTVAKKFPYRIAFNCIPHIGSFLPNGYTEEEMKMVNETRKIMEDDTIAVTATTVRVPVLRGHSEAVNIETEKKITAAHAREILAAMPNLVVIDEPNEALYPMPIDAEGKDATFVGRIREDLSIECGLDLWIVSDNLLKGAATNAVQIAELLL